ncbi:hypothetical protein RRF57_005202 [Xylaria bambusicola]|uniref:Uncharacterized protein n=1 Tax=Xylaria bambusicola TaxID=326684 RepID=A0AAN7UJF1_9PEZI
MVASVGLTEWLEKFCELLRRDSDACISDPESQFNLFGPVAFNLGANGDGSVFGKLETIADEVPEDLM